MDILGQTSLMVGVTSFSLGFSTLARNARNKLYLAFAILASLVSLWALTFFLERIWGGGVFYQGHLFFNIWLAPGALGFIRVLIRTEDGFSRRLLDASVLIALALTAVLLLDAQADPFLLNLIHFAPALIVLQIIQLMWADRRPRRGPRTLTVGLDRKNWIYLGGIVVLSTSVMDHVPWIGVIIPSLGNIALSFYLFFVSQAISKQRLLNFGALLSRFLVLLTVALTLTGIYSLLVAWIENSPGLFFLNSFIASFLILMLLEPIRTLVRYFTEQLLSQKHRRLERALREALQRLTGIIEPATLFQSILMTMQQILEPEKIALFVLRSDGTRYRRVRSVGVDADGGEALPLREILADHPLLGHCVHIRNRGELPILLDQILESELDRSASRVQRENLLALIQGLRALGANLLIPFIDSDQKILGFVAMRIFAPPEPWGDNWGLLSVIYPYFEQVARTMRSLEIFVRQREKERLAAVGEMAAGLAHEIRNPLGAIKGAAQFLDPSKDRPESKFLGIIIEETDRLNRVVTQFLDYSKPLTTEFQPLDLSLLVEKTLEVMRTSFPASVQVEFSAPISGARVLGNAGQLRQVLMNLIQNSLKALEGRDGVIRVSVEVDGRDLHGDVQREAVIHVEDSGVGIKRENLEKLFIPFFTTSPSGTGLGLPISQKIVEAHQGRIEVASEEGRFTRFSVVLPRK